MFELCTTRSYAFMQVEDPAGPYVGGAGGNIWKFVLPPEANIVFVLLLASNNNV